MIPDNFNNGAYNYIPNDVFEQLKNKPSVKKIFKDTTTKDITKKIIEQSYFSNNSKEFKYTIPEINVKTAGSFAKNMFNDQNLPQNDPHNKLLKDINLTYYLNNPSILHKHLEQAMLLVFEDFIKRGKVNKEAYKIKREKIAKEFEEDINIIKNGNIDLNSEEYKKAVEKAINSFNDFLKEQSKKELPKEKIELLKTRINDLLKQRDRIISSQEEYFSKLLSEYMKYKKGFIERIEKNQDASFLDIKRADLEAVSFYKDFNHVVINISDQDEMIKLDTYKESIDSIYGGNEESDKKIEIMGNIIEELKNKKDIDYEGKKEFLIKEGFNEKFLNKTVYSPERMEIFIDSFNKDKLMSIYNILSKDKNDRKEKDKNLEAELASKYKKLKETFDDIIEDSKYNSLIVKANATVSQMVSDLSSQTNGQFITILRDFEDKTKRNLLTIILANEDKSQREEDVKTILRDYIEKNKENFFGVADVDKFNIDKFMEEFENRLLKKGSDFRNYVESENILKKSDPNDIYDTKLNEEIITLISDEIKHALYRSIEFKDDNSNKLTNLYEKYKEIGYDAEKDRILNKMSQKDFDFQDFINKRNNLKEEIAYTINDLAVIRNAVDENAPNLTEYDLSKLFGSGAFANKTPKEIEALRDQLETIKKDRREKLEGLLTLEDRQEGRYTGIDKALGLKTTDNIKKEYLNAARFDYVKDFYKSIAYNPLVGFGGQNVAKNLSSCLSSATNPTISTHSIASNAEACMDKAIQKMEQDIEQKEKELRELVKSPYMFMGAPFAFLLMTVSSFKEASVEISHAKRQIMERVLSNRLTNLSDNKEIANAQLATYLAELRGGHIQEIDKLHTKEFVSNIILAKTVYENDNNKIFSQTSEKLKNAKNISDKEYEELLTKSYISSIEDSFLFKNKEDTKRDFIADIWRENRPENSLEKALKMSEDINNYMNTKKELDEIVRTIDIKQNKINNLIINKEGIEEEERIKKIGILRNDIESLKKEMIEKDSFIKNTNMDNKIFEYAALRSYGINVKYYDWKEEIELKFSKNAKKLLENNEIKIDNKKSTYKEIDRELTNKINKIEAKSKDKTTPQDYAEKLKLERVREELKRLRHDTDNEIRRKATEEEFLLGELKGEDFNETKKIETKVIERISKENLTFFAISDDSSKYKTKIEEEFKSLNDGTSVEHKKIEKIKKEIKEIESKLEELEEIKNKKEIEFKKELIEEYKKEIKRIEKTIETRKEEVKELIFDERINKKRVTIYDAKGADIAENYKKFLEKCDSKIIKTKKEIEENDKKIKNIDREIDTLNSKIAELKQERDSLFKKDNIGIESSKEIEEIDKKIKKTEEDIEKLNKDKKDFLKIIKNNKEEFIAAKKEKDGYLELIKTQGKEILLLEEFKKSIVRIDNSDIIDEKTDKEKKSKIIDSTEMFLEVKRREEATKIPLNKNELFKTLVMGGEKYIREFLEKSKIDKNEIQNALQRALTAIIAGESRKEEKSAIDVMKDIYINETIGDKLKDYVGIDIKKLKEKENGFVELAVLDKNHKNYKKFLETIKNGEKNMLINGDNKTNLNFDDFKTKISTTFVGENIYEKFNVINIASDIIKKTVNTEIMNKVAPIKILLDRDMEPELKDTFTLNNKKN